MDLVTTTIEHREKNNVMRKDLMQFLIQLRNNSDTDDKEWNFKSSSNYIYILNTVKRFTSKLV